MAQAGADDGIPLRLEDEGGLLVGLAGGGGHLHTLPVPVHRHHPQQGQILHAGGAVGGAAAAGEQQHGGYGQQQYGGFFHP